MSTLDQFTGAWTSTVCVMVPTRNSTSSVAVWFTARVNCGIWWSGILPCSLPACIVPE